MRRISIFVLCAIALLACHSSVTAQQAMTDIWKLVPSDSLLVAAFDGRPDNATVQVFNRAQDPATRQMMAKQHAALRKAVEDFATLFGVSLDFAKDIDSWAGEQWAFTLVPDEKKGVQPVFILASKDAAAANETLTKVLEPWQRVADVAPQDDSDYPITAIGGKGSGPKMYLSASGPVLAISTSKTALKNGLNGSGFAVDSPGDMVATALSGSIFSVFADPALLKLVNVKQEDVPLNGFGLGVSAIDTGAKVRILGFATERGAQMLSMMLPTEQTGSLAANAAIPSASLAVASLPNLGPLAIVGGIMGADKDSGLAATLSAIKPVSDLQVSAALTAVLPRPAWMISATADSPEIAAAKMEQVKANLREAKAQTWTAAPGVTAVGIPGPKGSAVYMAQTGNHLLLAGDVLAANKALATAEGRQPNITQSAVYNETIAGLEGSNVLTLYGSLAPIQGLGYLMDGLGFGQFAPAYGAIARSLENMHSFGIGAGFDGSMASITLFLRAKPDIGTTIGPAAVAGTAVGAAVLFPVFARAREAARVSVCMSNLKQLTMAAHMYAAEHNDKLPDRLYWRTQLKPYLGRDISELRCTDGEFMYAFNKNLGGIRRGQIKNPSETVMFFEAECDLPNATGSRADAILAHNVIGCFAFADGHAEQLSQLPPQPQWVPYGAQKPAKKAPATPRKSSH